MSKSAIFHIEGGIGKNIVASSVLRCFKKQNSDTHTIVNTVWPDIFRDNPYVDRVYQIGNAPYFYQDHVYGKDVEIYAQDPYKTTNHILKKMPIVESWCDLVGVQYDKSLPDIYYNFREREIAAHLLPKNGKPILIFQPFGGPTNQELPYSWTRDIHPNTAQYIVDVLSEKYDILHICYPHHPFLKNVIRFDQFLNKKLLLAVMEYSEKRILIDSSLQHAAAAMRLPSTVVWVATNPEIFGYDIHKNILPEKTFPLGNMNSYLFDYNFNGIVGECPYKWPEDIFNATSIIDSL